MSKQTEKREYITQWLPSDRKVIDNWLKNLFEELKEKHQDKLDLMLKLYPEAKDEKTALKGHPVVDLDKKVWPKLVLHPPVAALLDAILTDPGIHLFIGEKSI